MDNTYEDQSKTKLRTLGEENGLDRVKQTRLDTNGGREVHTSRARDKHGRRKAGQTTKTGTET